MQKSSYNVQFATDGDTRMIVAVDVINNGSDAGQMASLHEHLVEKDKKAPDHYVTDAAFATIEDVTKVEQAGSRVIAPVNQEQQIKKRGGAPYARRKDDTDEMLAFRQRMAEEEAKEILKTGPSIVEFPNAECRNRGLTQFRVRGLKKSKPSRCGTP